jgi:hypothetical protein
VEQTMTAGPTSNPSNALVLSDVIYQADARRHLNAKHEPLTIGFTLAVLHEGEEDFRPDSPLVDQQEILQEDVQQEQDAPLEVDGDRRSPSPHLEQHLLQHDAPVSSELPRKVHTHHAHQLPLVEHKRQVVAVKNAPALDRQVGQLFPSPLLLGHLCWFLRVTYLGATLSKETS